jgi:hypothetical protein
MASISRRIPLATIGGERCGTVGGVEQQPVLEKRDRAGRHCADHVGPGAPVPLGPRTDIGAQQAQRDVIGVEAATGVGFHHLQPQRDARDPRQRGVMSHEHRDVGHERRDRGVGIFRGSQGKVRARHPPQA